MLPLIIRFGVIIVLIYFVGLIYLKSVYPRIRYKENLTKLEHYYDDSEPVEYTFKRRESILAGFTGGLFDKAVESVYMMLPVDDEYQRDLGIRLRSAGIDEDPRYFLASSIISTFLIMVLFWVFSYLLGADILSKIKYIMLGMMVGILKARMTIFKGMKRRRWMIRKQLPDVLDILSASVAAGLAFDQSLSYVVDRGKGPLVNEFDIVMREITLGRPRKDALNAMAERCEVDEVTTLVGAINQATDYGIPMQNVLRTQSAIIRENRKMEAEESAAKMPVKMLFPMVVLIFPVIFIIILYPIIPAILESLAGAL